MKIPNGISGFIAPFSTQADVWSTRNFGYFGADPNVSGRTANESVEIVEWLNREVLESNVPEAQRIAGAGLTCPDDAKASLCAIHTVDDDCLAGCKLPRR